MLFRSDDALDVLGVHGVGGIVGLLVTGFFATTAANPALGNNLAAIVGRTLWLEQLKGIGLTLVWTCAGTALAAALVKAVTGLRPTVEHASDPRLEVHILGECSFGEGDPIEVEWLEFLRPERRFRDVAELYAQIVQDRAAAGAFFGGRSTARTS